MVHCYHSNGETHVFGPGDTPPKWAADQIKNPDAWDGGHHEDTDGGDGPDGGGEHEQPPPKGGPGSTLEAWQSYALRFEQVEIDDDMTREQIIAALDAAGVPTGAV